MTPSGIPTFRDRLEPAVAEQAGAPVLSLRIYCVEATDEMTLEAAVEAVRAPPPQVRRSMASHAAEPPDVTGALRTVEALRADGLIDDAEYQAKRRGIVAKL